MIPAAAGLTEDKVMEVALGAGADDMLTEEGGFTVTCQPNAFGEVSAAIEAASIVFDRENSQVGLIPLTKAAVKDVAVAKSVNKFVAALEDHDDVQDVYTNMDIDESIVLLDGAVNGGQSKAGAFAHALGGEKRLEKMSKCFSGHPRTIVTDGKENIFPGDNIFLSVVKNCMDRGVFRFDDQFSDAGNCIPGVDAQIGQDLVDL